LIGRVKCYHKGEKWEEKTGFPKKKITGFGY
jgi:hypothetical protein